MRAFLGISVPEELKDKIISMQKKLSGYDIKLVEPQNLHFNLKFFSEISDEDAGKLKSILESVCRQFKPFDIKISGIGAFPNPEYIRVAWVGVKDGNEKMAELADAIQDAVQPLGFEKERFEPHLTLGRVRSGRDKEKLFETLKKLDEVEVGIMKVDRITLFQSTLGPNGPLYEKSFDVLL
jgi:RNA 2',3'-cyclic 3'-phosphodiesterase